MEFNIFTNLALALLLCLVSSKIMKKIHLPNVTGYLIVGLIAGPYCAGLLPVHVVEQLSIIPEVALGFIAFSIGAEFKISYLRKVGKAPVIIAFMEALGAVLVVDLALIITGHNLAFSLVLGAIASATAPAATLMVIRQYKAKGPVTDTLLPVVAIDDAMALMAFGLSVAAAKAISSGQNGNMVKILVAPIVEIVGALLFGVVLGWLLTILTRWFTGRGNRLAVTFAMVLICIGISDMLGLSALLSCMAMSAVYVNLSKECKAVFDQVDRMTPPIFMLFFFVSGAELDLSVLPTVGVIGTIYVLSRVLGKVTGAFVGAKLSHASPVVSKYLGFALVPQAGVAIGLSSIAATVLPGFGNKIKTIILCGTIIYELVGPVITKLALRKAGEIK